MSSLQDRFSFSQKGGIKSWDNMSGHYQPPASAASKVGLPKEKFSPHD